jgi:hypothetical protein
MREDPQFIVILDLQLKKRREIIFRNFIPPYPFLACPETLISPELGSYFCIAVHKTLIQFALHLPYALLEVLGDEAVGRELEGTCSSVSIKSPWLNIRRQDHPTSLDI